MTSRSIFRVCKERSISRTSSSFKVDFKDSVGTSVHRRHCQVQAGFGAGKEGYHKGILRMNNVFSLSTYRGGHRHLSTFDWKHLFSSTFPRSHPNPKRHSHGDNGDLASKESDRPLTDLAKIAAGLQEGRFRSVLLLSGAGVSCSAGIPDFRTPGTGLYDNLQSYNLPYPEAIFDLSFYKHNPTPFITLAREIWPGFNHKPTIGHSFARLLENRGILLRNYTQNIDGLEVLAGVSPEKMVECHGHFRSASCVDCGSSHDAERCKREITESGSAPVCPQCGGLVKPDIVFFGEALPSRFMGNIESDAASCDLLIVMGTSLAVYPVAGIPDMVPLSCPRVLLNRKPVGSFALPSLDASYENVFEAGEIDESIRKICQFAGWLDELEDLHESTLSQVQLRASAA